MQRVGKTLTQSGKKASLKEPGGTISARNAQTVVVTMLNHVISALRMAQNLKVVEKPITGHKCATQSPSITHESHIEEILEDVGNLEQEIDEIGNNHITPVI